MASSVIKGHEYNFYNNLTLHSSLGPMGVNFCEQIGNILAIHLCFVVLSDLPAGSTIVSLPKPVKTLTNVGLYTMDGVIKTYTIGDAVINSTALNVNDKVNLDMTLAIR